MLGILMIVGVVVLALIIYNSFLASRFGGA